MRESEGEGEGEGEGETAEAAAAARTARPAATSFSEKGKKKHTVSEVDIVRVG